MIEHPGKRRMDEVMQKKIYCPDKTTDLCATARDFQSCERNRCKMKRQHCSCLLPLAGLVGFATIKMLWTVPEKKAGKQFIVVMTNSLLRLTKGPLETKNSNHSRNHFPDWLSNFGISFKILIDNGLQFISELFQDICSELNVKPIATTEYHAQIIEHLERLNATISSQLFHYAARHQQAWDSYVAALEYLYNLQVRRAAKLLLFSFVLSQQLPVPAALTASPMSPDIKHVNSPVALESRLIRQASELKQIAGVSFRQAQRCYKLDQDKTIRFEPTFSAWSYFFVNFRH